MKEKLLENVEKIALAVCVLLMGLFFWSAFSLSTYSKTPEDFTKVTKTARDAVGRTKVNENDLQAPDLKNISASLVKSVDDQAYAFKRQFRRQFDFGFNFRREPEVLKPSKPLVQANRGLLSMYETDLQTGKLLRVKVPRSKAQVPIAKSAPGAAAAIPGNAATGQDGRLSLDPNASAASREIAAEAAFGNNTAANSIVGVEPPAVESDGEVASVTGGGGAGGGFARFSFKLPQKAAPDEKKDKAAAKKEDEMVESYVIGQRGKHFVEIVATFPHEEEVRRFVQALKEPPDFVGLMYSMAEVERRQFIGDPEWSDWEPIPIKEQLDVVLHAANGVEAEPFPAVAIPGLAMNIPKRLSTGHQNVLTHPDLQNPLEATYTPDEMNPLAAARKANPQPTEGRRRRAAPKAPDGTKPASTVRLDPKLVRLAAPVDPNKAAFKGATKDGKAAVTNHFKVKNALIRFWDFTVLPGVRYQYRIRVNTFNPNFGRLDVADASFSTKRTLKGPWSEPSDEVYVEPDVKWYCKDKGTLDRAVLEVHAWPIEAGTWLVKPFSHRVGDLIGLSGPPQQVAYGKVNFQTNEVEKAEIPSRQVFDSGMILLDVSGGREKIVGAGRPFKMPVEAVAVNSYGDLIRHNQEEYANDEIRAGYATLYDEILNKVGGDNKAPVNNDEDGEKPAEEKPGRLKLGR